MKENKLTPEEIKKALECCKPDNDEGCLSCPLSDVPVEECSDILHTATLDLINRQQEEREAMLEDLQFRTNQVIEQQAEIERLQEEIGSLNKSYPCRVDVGNSCLVYARSLDDYDNLIGNISAEAIKEFAERLKEHLKGNGGLYCVTTMNAKIDILVKEMVGK